jgi:hypothetical protein
MLETFHARYSARSGLRVPIPSGGLFFWPPQLAASFMTALTRATRRMVFPARQMIFDVIGDLLAGRRQRKQFALTDGIVCLLGKLPYMAA